jgi:hypothetical protein
MPPIKNILDVLPADLVAEVRDDAEAVMSALRNSASEAVAEVADLQKVKHQGTYPTSTPQIRRSAIHAAEAAVKQALIDLARTGTLFDSVYIELREPNGVIRDPNEFYVEIL